MSVEFNHTIVWSRDSKASATFLADMMGLPPARAFGPFMAVELAHGLSFDFASAGSTIGSPGPI